MKAIFKGIKWKTNHSPTCIDVGPFKKGVNGGEGGGYPKIVTNADMGEGICSNSDVTTLYFSNGHISHIFSLLSLSHVDTSKSNWSDLWCYHENIFYSLVSLFISFFNNHFKIGILIVYSFMLIFLYFTGFLSHLSLIIMLNKISILFI